MQMWEAFGGRKETEGQTKKGIDERVIWTRTHTPAEGYVDFPARDHYRAATRIFVIPGGLCYGKSAGDHLFEFQVPHGYKVSKAAMAHNIIRIYFVEDIVIFESEDMIDHL